jgi:LacI family transcriptional regulator
MPKSHQWTMKDVAELAGVSIATVSRVLNHPDQVNRKTIERVKTALDSVSYSPNGWAQATARTGPPLVGLVLPDILNPFFAAVYVGMNEVLRAKGITLWMADSQNRVDYEREALETLQRYRAQGIVLIPTHSSANLDTVHKMDAAVCVVDRKLQDNAWDLVVIDNLLGGREATQLLIDAGHERIAIITGPEGSTSAHDRYRGYLTAMEQNGLTVPQDYVKVGDFKQFSGFTLGQALLQLPNRPTAIFSCNNLMTMGLLEAIRASNGLGLGSEVAVVGFDEIPIATLVQPPLTVIASPVKELGVQAVRLILERLENPSKGRETVLLPPQLLIRGSERLTKTKGESNQ